MCFWRDIRTELDKTFEKDQSEHGGFYFQDFDGTFKTKKLT